MVVAAATALLAVATLRHVWSGGTTLNDHAVAVVVLGCLLLYPILWWGAVQSGAESPLLAAALGAGAVGIWVLFALLGTRVELRPAGMALGVGSQVAYAFSLWAGLLIILRAPVAWGLGLPVAWPGVWLVLPLLLALWGTAWTWLRRHKVVQLRIQGPEVAGRPLCIVQLSDLHASPLMRGQDLDALADEVERLRPDIIVVTGDLVMPFSEDHHHYLLRSLSRLRQLAPVLACPGNHDLPVADQLADELAALDVAWLVDRALTLDGTGWTMPVQVLGVDFRWQGLAAHLDHVLEQHPAPPAPMLRLLLAHDPRVFAHVPPDRFTLVLSGHTHGGQVGLQMLGMKGSLLGLLGVRDHGLFHRPGASLWVHAGSWHTGLPPRMGVAPEIVQILSSPSFSERPTRA